MATGQAMQVASPSRAVPKMSPAIRVNAANATLLHEQPLSILPRIMFGSSLFCLCVMFVVVMGTFSNWPTRNELEEDDSSLPGVQDSRSAVVTDAPKQAAKVTAAALEGEARRRLAKGNGTKDTVRAAFQEPSSSLPYPPIIESRQQTDNPLSLRLLLTVVVIAILVAAVALVATRVVRTQKGVCATIACRDFAELARRSLNETVPPCENFGHFVCGQWKKRNSAKASTRHMLYATALETLFKSLTSAHNLPRYHSMREQVRAFFSSCSAVSRGERDEIITVRGFLEEAGITWPLVPSNPDVLDTMLYLDLELNWPSILQVRVKKDKHIFKVSIEPAMSFRELVNLRARLSTREERRHYFDVVFRHYGQGVPEEQAYSQVEEVEGLMATKLESVMPRHHESASFEELDTDELYRDSSNWTERLAKRMRIRSSVKYYTSSKPFLVTFFELWSQHGDSRMHLYLSWCAVRFTAPFSNRELLRNHYGLDAEDLMLGQNCLFLSYQIFGDTIFAEFNAEVFTTEVRQDVRDLVLAVRKSFARRLSQSAFTESTSLVANWGTLDRVFFVLECRRHYDLEHAASHLPDMSHSFVINWRIMSQTLRTVNASLGVLEEAVLSGRSLFRLDWNIKDFILSPFALLFPMYDVKLTPAVKYGALGDQIGLATAQLALNHIEQQPSAQFELSLSRQCVKQAFEKHAELPSNAIVELASLSELLDAFAKSGDGDLRISGLVDYTALQTFFIAWCLMRCRATDLYRDEDDPCSPVLRLFEAFADAFQCSPETYMNAKTKCTVL
ncbi:neprilysin-1-like [Dermacentor andersoni]|uniref:neprilysin-1-like n=1 Tax=Dermacentor andersoni TaxID=34620 RepID=UPI003B3B2561